MAYSFIVNRLKALLFSILNIFIKALCCFRRRRSLSHDNDNTLVDIGIIPNDIIKTSENKDEEISWNQWDDTPTSITCDKSPVQQQIELFRQKAIQPDSEPQMQIDYFEDMAPQLTKQKKILLKNNHPNDRNEGNCSRLTFPSEPILYASTELETWEDRAGWEQQTQEDWDVEGSLRETRFLERQRRLALQKLKREQREQAKMSRQIGLGFKLS